MYLYYIQEIDIYWWTGLFAEAMLAVWQRLKWPDCIEKEAFEKARARLDARIH